MELIYRGMVKDGVNGVDGLSCTTSVTVSPDGSHVYATGVLDNAVAVFSRDATTGLLTFVEIQIDGQNGVDGLASPRSVVVSPDGRHVYVTGADDDATVLFSRDATTGVLTFEAVYKDGQGGVDGLYCASAVTVSPDGRHVYVTGSYDNAVAVFSRNTDTGVLTFVEAQKDGLNGVDGLEGAYSVAVSPDQRHVYTAGVLDKAVAVFSRNTNTGALAFVEVQKDGQNGVDGLESPWFVTVSPDGRHVYAAVYSDGAVAVFSRNASTGALTFVEVLKDGQDGVDGLRGAMSVTVSPDGNHVYASGSMDYAVAIFSPLYTQTEFNAAVEAVRLKWDVDDDDQTGLSEVRHGLQIISGQQP